MTDDDWHTVLVLLRVFVIEVLVVVALVADAFLHGTAPFGLGS